MTSGAFVLAATLRMLSSQRFCRMRSSPSSSATRLPSAEVRTMTLKFFGFTLWMSWRRRARSSLDLILVETDILSAKGIRTRNRPAKDISAVSRGPFVEMGSLAICTSISSPTVRASPMVPSLSMSGCRLTFCTGCRRLGSPRHCLRNFCCVLKVGPRS